MSRVITWIANKIGDKTSKVIIWISLYYKLRYKILSRKHCLCNIWKRMYSWINVIKTKFYVDQFANYFE